MAWAGLEARFKGGPREKFGIFQHVIGVVWLLQAWPHLTRCQDPSGTWTPNLHHSLGLTCGKDAPNPNLPAGHTHHNGGCGCENTLLRLDGKLYLMESASHGLDDVFPGIYNTKKQGDNSYFRLRDFKSGFVIANVSQSIGHSFCAAVADHQRRQCVPWQLLSCTC
eukprot:SAG11_NODE_1361_length_5112_cov_2.921404_5_plen_166_part_00